MVEVTTVFKNVIGGEVVDSASGQTYDVVDPTTGAVYAVAPMSGVEDIDRAYSAAADAQLAWGDTPPQERAQALLRIADAVDLRAEELARIEATDTGKPYGPTLSGELPVCSDALRFYAGAARILEGRSAGEYAREHTSWIRREPIGVVGQVTPWNYPLMMAAWKIAPALAAGNSVVLKPSDTTPATTTVLAEISQEYLPAGVLNVVCGDRNTGRAVIAHKAPQLVAITGSVRAGMEVAGAASADLKRVHLELGGKAPVVVFDDVDIDEAAAAIAEAGYANAGQDCTAATRVLVHARVHDDFVAALVNATKEVTTGGHDVADVTYGAINNAHQLAHIADLVDRIPEHALLETGGTREGDRGYFYAPTVISGLRQNDEQVQREIFGPVITVQRFGDEAEAVRWANDVAFGLAASVWTNDHRTALRMSKRLDFGTVWINTHLTTVSEMPHGGFKHSGYGKDLSLYGLEDYTRIKHVMSHVGQ